MVRSSDWTDDELAELIKTEFAWNALIEQAQLEATVKDGVATIFGSVGTLAEKYVAIDAALSVYGVHDVLAEIEVRVAPQDNRTDRQLVDIVRTTLEWDALVPEADLRVSVEHGWVTLGGHTPTATQRDEAERAIARLVGVRGVNNEISLRVPTTTPLAIHDVISEALRRRAAHLANNIDVVVDGDRVTLAGQVPSAQHKRALLGAVSHAPGVETVCDALVIAHEPRKRPHRDDAATGIDADADTLA